MFESVIDMLMLSYYGIYDDNRDKIEEGEDDFSKSKERKKMNELVQAIVILYQNKNGRP